MARAVTAKFHEYIVEVETAPASGTYEIICGLTSRGMNRTNNIDENEVPDCDDESLPLAVEKDVRSTVFSISGSGVWSQQSHEKMMDWAYLGSKLNVQLRHVNALSGDTLTETGPAILATLGDAVEKGQRVTQEIDIQFDGTPVRAAAP